MGRFGIVASALFTMAACGDDDAAKQFLDAGPQDDAAPGDGAPGDGVPTGMVNVTTLSRDGDATGDRSPIAGVNVFAVSATGAIVSTGVTDDLGKATLSLPAGGSVTAVYPSGGDGVNVATYVGVKPGDSLTFGDRRTYFTGIDDVVGNVTLTWAPVANATSYRYYSPCSSDALFGGTTVTTELRIACRAATARIGVVAYDEGGQVLASVILPAAPYTAGTTITIDASQWVAQTPEPNYAITLTGLDSGVDDVLLGVYDELANEELAYFTDFANPRSFTPNLTPVGGTSMTGLSAVNGVTRTVGVATAEHETYEGRQWFFKNGASPLALDASTLPWIQTFTADNKNLRVSWTRSAGTADAMWMRFEDGANRTWTVILPPDVTQFDASAVPTEIAEFLPALADNVLPHYCQLVDLSSATSYDAARALPEWRVTETQLSVRGGDEPSAAYSDCGEGFNFR